MRKTNFRTEGEAVSYTVGPVDMIPVGEALKVESDDSGAKEDIAIFHAEDGNFYALQDECTHEVASLSEGWIEDCEVECPLHASRFNLKTGKVLCLPAYVDARTYKVEVIDGMLELHF
ncbi:bifunctional 3-phenylpropionate/cinnamic acid dioxygenase ferredoxin subunit [Glutamicibacter sp. V16R2B1]|nr:bifunctional 3-phenylpropionate/cinnamic acid dioxygenase ferredoxin subunit [Glutamicibacter sp. V16R2B1]